MRGLNRDVAHGGPDRAPPNKAAGKKLEMGKSCLRFKTVEELPLDVICDIVASMPFERRVEVAEAARKKNKG